MFVELAGFELVGCKQPKVVVVGHQEVASSVFVPHRVILGAKHEGEGSQHMVWEGKERQCYWS